VVFFLCCYLQSKVLFLVGFGEAKNIAGSGVLVWTAAGPFLLFDEARINSGSRASTFCNVLAGT
jgi:hypothetical protein